MTAAARKRAAVDSDPNLRNLPAARPSALEVFTARSEARALLWRCLEFNLHEAVDVLQHAAERDGLSASLGQDEVQRIMVEAFAPVREDVHKFEHISDDEEDPLLEGLKICADTERHLAEWERRKRERAAAEPEMVPDALPEVDGRGASDSTVEAVVYALREYGTDALHRGNTRECLAELSNRQIESVIARLARMSSKYSTVSERLLLALAELLP